MKTWIISLIIVLMLLTSVFAFNFITADNSEEDTRIIESVCKGSCGNLCNAESNCGLSSCKAIDGQGSCGCGR